MTRVYVTFGSCLQRQSLWYMCLRDLTPEAGFGPAQGIHQFEGKGVGELEASLRQSSIRYPNQVNTSNVDSQPSTMNNAVVEP